MTVDIEAACTLVRRSLTGLADPEKAEAMQAYMKTDMPFYGVTKTDQRPILRHLVDEYSPDSVDEYRELVGALWELPHREEKYLAVGYARRFGQHIEMPQLDLYRRMIEEGAWWDFVDEIAAHLVGALVLENREAMSPVLEEWIESDDLWLRRSAILCQLRHKSQTDVEMLLDFSRRRAHEKEFFIRKAIGWALREYAKTDPDTVRSFLAEQGDRLSGLTRREAAKHL